MKTTNIAVEDLIGEELKLNDSVSVTFLDNNVKKYCDGLKEESLARWYTFLMAQLLLNGASKIKNKEVNVKSSQVVKYIEDRHNDVLIHIRSKVGSKK